MPDKGGGEGGGEGKGVGEAAGTADLWPAAKMPAGIKDARHLRRGPGLRSALPRSLRVLLGPDALQVTNGEHKVRLSHHACTIGCAGGGVGAGVGEGEELP